MPQGRWTSLMNAFSIDENADTYLSLIKAYSEKHRAYHTWEHIAACLHHLDVVKDQTDEPHEIELALWFHDAVYKPFSSTNEKDSADWADRFLRENQVNDDIVRRVYDLIIVTEHSGAPKTNDEKLMIDIDLSILGTRADVYDQFEKDVRFEYKRVPKFIFKKRRREILSEFLTRDPIYHNAYFREQLERQARDNLKRAISNLS